MCEEHVKSRGSNKELVPCNASHRNQSDIKMVNIAEQHCLVSNLGPRSVGSVQNLMLHKILELNGVYRFLGIPTRSVRNLCKKISHIGFIGLPRRIRDLVKLSKFIDEPIEVNEHSSYCLSFHLFGQ